MKLFKKIFKPSLVIMTVLAIGGTLLGSADNTALAKNEEVSATLIIGARIFDGVGPDLIEGQNILV